MLLTYDISTMCIDDFEFPMVIHPYWANVSMLTLRQQSTMDVVPVAHDVDREIGTVHSFKFYPLTIDELPTSEIWELQAHIR